MDKLIEVVLAFLAGILAIGALIQSRAASLVAWGLLLLAIALLVLLIGPKL